MALIIEDGSNVTGADSFVSLADARVIAASYGLNLPAIDADAELALKMGVKWIAQRESELQGDRAFASQALSFPRAVVCIYGYEQESDFIPEQLKEAQVIAAVEQGLNGGILAAETTPANGIKKEVLDGVGEFEYFEGATGITTPANIKLALSILKPITKAGISVGGGLRVQR